MVTFAVRKPTYFAPLQAGFSSRWSIQAGSGPSPAPNTIPRNQFCPWWASSFTNASSKVPSCPLHPALPFPPRARRSWLHS